MKGGHSSRYWRRHSFFTMAALVFTTIFFWSWESNPLIVSLISNDDPFIMHSPDLFVDDSAESSLLVNSKNRLKGDDSASQLADDKRVDEDDSAESSLLVNSKNQLKEDDSVFQLADDKRVDKDVRHSDSANMLSIEKKDEKGDSASSLHKKDLFEEGSVESSVLSNSQEQVKDEVSTSQLAEGGESTKGTKLSDGASVLPSEVKDAIRNFVSSNKKACNYAKGRWIPDSRQSLYSGFGCKQWLSDMWACRLTQRTDFSYERYRWQPSDCEIPEFQGAEFLRKMQDKTLAFIGDSLGRQQFQSLMCMITGGKEMPQVEDVGKKYGLAKPRRALRPDGWAYWFPETNTTVLYYWSASLCDVEPIDATNPATEFAMHLDRPPAFLRQYLLHFHVVVLNTGHHWNRGKLRANRWVMYSNGKPVLDRKLAMMGNAKNHTLYSIARWFDSQISLHPHLKVFLRTISPRHFSHGEWNTGGKCDNLIPMLKGSQVVQDRSSDPVTEGVVWGTKVKILDITALSELRDEAHISHYSRKASDGINDCLHWCLPGIPDTWNELVYAQL